MWVCAAGVDEMRAAAQCAHSVPATGLAPMWVRAAGADPISAAAALAL